MFEVFLNFMLSVMKQQKLEENLMIIKLNLKTTIIDINIYHFLLFSLKFGHI